MTLHDSEFPIDDALVAGLVFSQMPAWSDLQLRRVETTGTVNVLYRLGDDLVVRLPRTAEYSGGPQREASLLPRFADRLPLEIPVFHALGTPTDRYPSHWSVLGWIEGSDADLKILTDPLAAAEALGECVVAIRRTPTEGVDPGRNDRGLGLPAVDTDARRWIERLPVDIDPSAVAGTWEACVSAPQWSGPPTWFHGDLRQANLLARAGRLAAVIDWEGCSVGDPSCDLLAGWWVFDAEAREVFRSTTRATEDEWLRGKGWALLMAVAAIPYYAGSNPRFAAQARHALSEILAD